MAFNTRLHPDDLPRVSADLAAAITTAGVFDSKYRLVLAAGCTRWVGAHGRTLARAVGDYDDLYPGEPRDTNAAIEFLAALATSAAPPSVLEFGSGTGRLAIPLRQRGFDVHGLDGSEDMAAALHAKRGGADLPVHIGDYRNACVGEHRFGVVVLVLNGIFDPRGLAAQIDVFANASRHLAAGGYFVVESWVMTPAEQNGEWSLLPRCVGAEHVELQLARYDIDANRIERTLVHLRSGPPTFMTVTDTYASPGQLDVIAHVTGFERVSRSENWSTARFTSASRNHVSTHRTRADPAR